MSQELTRLRELLLDSEISTLADLGRRMDSVYERAGTADRFTASVAATLDAALRQAEVERHADVAQAIAPLIVQTIRTEIRNSEEELAEALYPSVGRMAKAYVASAMRDLTDDINRRLESNHFMLRVRSLLTWRPVAELAFTDGQRLKVEEILLMRRGLGQLVGRWPATESISAHGQRISGILIAINEVATEAFAADQSSLRRIDLGGALVYLRSSPTHLLAAKCSGASPSAVERIMDDQFVAAIGRLRPLLNGAANGVPAELAINDLLADLAMALQAGIDEQQDKLARGRSVFRRQRCCSGASGRSSRRGPRGART